ncbi:PHD finger domain-containing protein [Zavarzinella formosa]|uniref:PHD finger domain-containing protein n=1 Tax=Zavarzinella formosa TaxID=360055 RepID=UPI0002EAEADE|nr:PHD finger domain-containing protein [Zavarzinella formosa]
MHVAGKTCVLCRQHINGNRDGAFCDRCDSPVHISCVEAGPPPETKDPCKRCGASRRARRAQERKAEQAEAAENRAAGRPEVFGGLVLVAAGLTGACGLMAMMGGNLMMFPTILIAIGIGLIARGSQKMKGSDPGE